MATDKTNHVQTYPILVHKGIPLHLFLISYVYFIFNTLFSSGTGPHPCLPVFFIIIIFFCKLFFFVVVVWSINFFMFFSLFCFLFSQLLLATHFHFLSLTLLLPPEFSILWKTFSIFLTLFPSIRIQLFPLKATHSNKNIWNLEMSKYDGNFSDIFLYFCSLHFH